MWSDINPEEPKGTSLGDVSVVAGRIDNLVNGLDGTEDLGAVKISGGARTGGSIDNTAIGSTTPSTGSFTIVEADTVDIDGGTIDDTPIGDTTPSTGAFTTITCDSIATDSNDALKMKVLSVTATLASGGSVSFLHNEGSNMRGVSGLAVGTNMNERMTVWADDDRVTIYNSGNPVSSNTYYVIIFYI